MGAEKHGAEETQEQEAAQEHGSEQAPQDQQEVTAKRCPLDAHEFIRRFLMHVLPKGFAKIRHYGILASRGKAERMALCKRLTGTPARERAKVDPAAIVERMVGRPPGTCARYGCKLVMGPLPC